MAVPVWQILGFSLPVVYPGFIPDFSQSCISEVPLISLRQDGPRAAISSFEEGDIKAITCGIPSQVVDRSRYCDDTRGKSISTLCRVEVVCLCSTLDEGLVS